MNGLSFQSIRSLAAQAVQPTVTAAGGSVTPAAGGEQGTPAPVELELSELARALEKLAQTPGLDEAKLTQLASLLNGQGGLSGLLGLLTESGKPAKGAASAGRPTPIQTDATLAGQVPSTGDEGGGGSAPQGVSAIMDFQARIAQSLQRLAVALKGNWALPLAFPTETPAEAGMNETVATVANPGRQARTPATAPNLPAALKAGLGEFIQSPLEQLATTLQQFASRLVAPTQPAAATASPQAAAAATINAAAAATPNDTSFPPRQAVAEVAEALSRMQNEGKLAQSPLMRKEFIRASLGIVSTLLNDPVPISAAGTPPARAAVTPAPAASPKPDAASPSPPSSEPATQVAPASETVQAVGERLQQVARTVDGLKGWLTADGQETAARLEGVLKELPKGANAAEILLPAEAAEWVRRGIRFELELRATPRLAAAVAELSQPGIQAEVARAENSPVARLRVTVQGSDPQAEPKPLERQADGVETGKREVEKNKSLPGASHAGKKEGSGAPALPQDESVAGAGVDSAARTQDARAALTAPAEGATRDGAGETTANPETARSRFEQYSHPEAFRSAPQTRQEAAVVQMAAFFQSRREATLQGQWFTPEAGSTADAARILAPERLLEFKPIEVLRPEAGIQSESREKTGASEPPVIDVRPVSVSRG